MPTLSPSAAGAPQSKKSIAQNRAKAVTARNKGNATAFAPGTKVRPGMKDYVTPTKRPSGGTPRIGKSPTRIGKAPAPGTGSPRPGIPPFDPRQLPGGLDNGRGPNMGIPGGPGGVERPGGGIPGYNPGMIPPPRNGGRPGWNPRRISPGGRVGGGMRGGFNPGMMQQMAADRLRRMF